MANTTNNTDETADGNFTAPAISLPKGGGAIRGIGEKFATNPVTGTGSVTIPIATSPGRSGFGPQLALSYDSGAGNGPFGLGWTLSLPTITRKTDKGLPVYHDDEESDTFILSGSEDLVPVLVQGPDGRWARKPLQRSVNEVAYQVQRYRPRIEGLFTRIERWVNVQTRETHWRSITRDNVTTIYGRTKESRIFDPADHARVFSWLICESFDDKGNAIRYEYQREDSAGITRDAAHEWNRTEASRSAQLYLKRVKYGNVPSRLVEPDFSRVRWLFEVVFDYDEGHYASLPVDAKGQQLVRVQKDASEKWTIRPDAFSSHRAAFEVRTYRLCQRVLMFHHFRDKLGTDDYLVRSTEFNYKQTPIASFITDVTQSGYVRRDSDTYLKKSMPALEFEYSEATIDDRIQTIDAAGLENLPYGLDGTNYRWVDLDGEGLSGILTEQANTWFYKPNLGGGNFGPLEVVAAKPSLGALNSGQQQLIDLAGDGQLDLVDFSSAPPGFYERTQDQNWEPFASFTSLPNINFDDPNLRFVDLTGDGHADILITENEAFTWHPSLAEEGFGPAEKVPRAIDEEKGPRIIFADGTQTIYLADMSGDGLSDLVRIRNSDVCYWPSLGYGRFGSKVTMDHAPLFDRPDLFDVRRVYLADIDGSGVTDIVYLGSDGIRLYFNQSGNSWSAPRSLPYFPAQDNLSSVTVVDLLGNGTACVVWSSPLPGVSRAPMRYVDLMGGQKPHLMIAMKNNLGSETHFQYAPSTKFYLADKLKGTPWVTRLPFPVHVVERVDLYDAISRNRFVTKYEYRHGYFDGVEREFRGFGYVEQRDTEEFAALSSIAGLPGIENIDEASHVPPILTKTWFHTGYWSEGKSITRRFREEYYREPGLDQEGAAAKLLPPNAMPADLDASDLREAHRALKGSLLRTETYALDDTPQSLHPYTVAEANYAVKQLQPPGTNEFGVYFTHAREMIDYRYERKPLDPRIGHAITFAVDEFGNVARAASIGYGRRNPDPSLSAGDQAKQAQTFMTCTQSKFTNAIDLNDDYRTPMLCESQTYELTGLPAGSDRFDFDFLDRAISNAAEIAYETEPSGGLQKRLIEDVRTIYRRNDLEGPLPLETLESLALPFESYKKTFTPGLLGAVFQGRVTEEILAEGGYVHSEGDENWWLPSGRVFFSTEADSPAGELSSARQHFFGPRRYVGPLGGVTTVIYDDVDLLPVETRDAVGNIRRSTNDYRVVQPVLVTDANGNRSSAAFDALGMLVGTAVMGKEGEHAGDSLEGFENDLDEPTILAHLQDPLANPQEILKRATTRMVYDLHLYQRTSGTANPQPNVVYTLSRETHDADLQPGELTVVQHSFAYSDGMGREIQKKIQAEPGPVSSRDAKGRILVDDNNQTVLTGKVIGPRWVGSGWTIFNNKGKPFRRFEPFFSDTHRFESDVKVGVSLTLFYDPGERIVATLQPNHTWEKTVFDAWRQENWDANDTVLVADPKTDPDVGMFFRSLPSTDYLPTWYQQRESGALGPEEQTAARKAAVHATTPDVIHSDSLGRLFLTVKQNKSRTDAIKLPGPITPEFYNTRANLDIEGNHRQIIDAKDRIITAYDYNMLSTRIHQSTMEAGEHWMLNDVAGKPFYSWDSRNRQFHTRYDGLRRPTDALLRQDGGAEILVARTVYGETEPDPEANNLRGKVSRLFDQAGVAMSDKFDFKGNLLQSRRIIAREYKTILDWNTEVELEKEAYASSTTYDALDRPTELVSPDKSIINPHYNEANLLASLEVKLRGADEVTPFVNQINYNVKGHRERVVYGNGAVTSYEYDPVTFRLVHLTTERPGDRDGLASELFENPGVIQDLRYTFDPVGNITQIGDAALKTIFHDGQQINAVSTYTYDAIYRLIEATGREHIGQTTLNFDTPAGKNRDYPFTGSEDHANDYQALRNYTERYEYDSVGNFLVFRHLAVDGSWTRRYEYNERSQIQEKQVSNRLSRTTVGDGVNKVEPYSYDVQGNMISMPHLPMLAWNFEEQLQQIDLGGGGTAYYVYDSTGERVRKVIESQNGVRRNERIYLGSFEVYREFGGRDETPTLERETLHVSDDKKRLALVETQTVSETKPIDNPAPLVRYQFGNHLVSTNLELDTTGSVVTYEEHHPFGTSSFQAGRSIAELSLKRYRYTSKERDEESGFYYHGARYYAPWLGWWVSADDLQGDIRSPMSLHRYVYANANPVIYTDPDGRIGTLATAGIGLLIGGIGGAIIGAWTAKPGERWKGAGKGALIGAGTGALAGLTLGLSLVGTGAIGLGGTAVATGGTTGSVLVSGTLAGAVGGGSNAAITTLANGGSAEDAVTMGKIGAFTGSIGGAVGGATGPIAGKLATSYGASQLTSFAAGGATAGLTGDVATQTASIAVGTQQSYSPAQTLVSTVGGGAAGALAHMASKPAAPAKPASAAPAAPATSVSPTPAVAPAATPAAPGAAPAGTPGPFTPARPAATWQQHETNVTQMQQSLHGTTNVGTQVTIDVTGPGPSGPETITIRADNTVTTASGNVQIVDAKFSAVRNLANPGTNLQSTVTTNQSRVYNWITSGAPITAVPRGPNAQAANFTPNMPITLEPTVQMCVNDPVSGAIVTRNYP
jgi:RHS repeat-associated protein